MIINTPYGPGSRGDGYLLRTEAVRRGVTCVTAMSAANTYVSAIEAVREDQQGHGSANDMGMDVIACRTCRSTRCSATCSAGAAAGHFLSETGLREVFREKGPPPAPACGDLAAPCAAEGTLRDD